MSARQRKTTVSYDRSPTQLLETSTTEKEFAIQSNLAHPDHVIEAGSSVHALIDLAMPSYIKASKLDIVEPTIMSFTTHTVVRVENVFNPYIHELAPEQQLYIYYPCIVTFHDSKDGPAVVKSTNLRVFCMSDRTSYMYGFRVAIVAVLKSVTPAITSLSCELTKKTLIVGNTDSYSFVTGDRRIGRVVKDATQTYTFYELPPGTYQLNNVRQVSASAAKEYMTLYKKIYKAAVVTKSCTITDALDSSQYDVFNTGETTVFSLGPGSDLLPADIDQATHSESVPMYVDKYVS